VPTRRAFVLGAVSAAVLAACGKARHQATATANSSAPGGTGSSATTQPGATGATGAAPGGPAAYVPHGPRDQQKVALTFHGSGDPALTSQLLTLAGQHQAPITVFAVGTWLEQHADLAGQILLGGHELANHTYTHPSLGRLGQAAVAGEITKCRDVLLRQISTNGRWFRPSGIDAEPSAMILAEAGKAGYPTCVGFDVDSLDYTDPGSNAVVQKVAAGVQPGSIISLHLGHAGTVSAFPHIMATLQSRGLRPVLVRDLLGA
jgi:peptidoglycan/xylan/chitin deacetylase (PgdA/CDA1 family)